MSSSSTQAVVRWSDIERLLSAHISSVILKAKYLSHVQRIGTLSAGSPFKVSEKPAFRGRQGRSILPFSCGSQEPLKALSQSKFLIRAEPPVAGLQDRLPGGESLTGVTTRTAMAH